MKQIRKILTVLSVLSAMTPAGLRAQTPPAEPPVANENIESFTNNGAKYTTSIPDPRSELEVVPGSYGFVPLRITNLKTVNPVVSDGLDFIIIKHFGDDEFLLGDMENYGGPIEEGETATYQVQVGKLYEIRGRNAHIDLLVDPGYEILLNGRVYDKAVMYINGEYIGDSENYCYLQVVPKRGIEPFGEAKISELGEVFSWGVSLGKSYSGRKTFSFVPTSGEPSDDYFLPFESLTGEKHPYSEAGSMGVIGNIVPLHGAAFHEVLEEFKRIENLNTGSLAKRQTLLDLENGTATYYHGATVENQQAPSSFEYKIELQNVLSGQEHIGFDMTVYKNTASYRKYEIRVNDDISTPSNSYLTIKIERGNGQFVRMEKLVFDSTSSTWSRKVYNSTAMDSSSMLKETTATFGSLTSPKWSVDVKTYGASSRLSEYYRNEYNVITWSTADLQTFSQNRLEKNTRYSDASGTQTWVSEYTYYDGVSNPDYSTSPSFLQTKTITHKTGTSVDDWAGYSYHDWETYNTTIAGAYTLEDISSSLGMDVYLSGKPGRPYRIFKPFMDSPSTPNVTNTAAGKVTTYYYRNQGIPKFAFNDFVTAKIERTQGTITSKILGWSFTGYTFTPDGEFWLNKTQEFRSVSDLSAPFGTWISDFDQLGTDTDILSKKITGRFENRSTKLSYMYKNDSNTDWSLNESDSPKMPAVDSTSEGGWVSGTTDSNTAVYAEFDINILGTALKQNESTMERRFYNLFSELIRTETHVWTAADAASVISAASSGWTLVDWTNNSYSDHRLVSVADKKGTLEQRNYYANTSPYYGLLQSVTSKEGVVSTYTYDALGRNIGISSSADMVSIAGVDHMVPARAEVRTFDGNGRLLKSTVNSALVEVNRYDAAGHLTVKLNGDGDGVQYTYTNDLNGHRMVTEQKVWGTGSWSNIWDVTQGISGLDTTQGNVSTCYYLDGTVYKKSGTGIVTEVHSVALDSSSTIDTTFIKSVTRGVTNPITVKTGIDMVGRTTYSSEPSITTGREVRTVYNYGHDLVVTTGGEYTMDYVTQSATGFGGSGQPSSKEVVLVNSASGAEISQMMAAEEYAYDGYGRLIKTTLNVPSSHVETDTGGLSDSVSYRELSHSYGFVNYSSGYWSEEATTALSNDASSTDSVVLSRKRSRVSGFTTSGDFKLVSETHSWGVDGASTPSENSATISKTEVDRTHSIVKTTVIQPGVTGQRRTLESYSSHGLELVISEPSGGSTKNTYDSQWRISTVNGPRGVLVAQNHYKTSGGTKLNYVVGRIADSTATGTLQSFTYESNSSGGRLTQESDAQSNTTYYAYNSRDQLLKTWGTKVNPVEYAYDEFGRKIKMYTYRDDTTTDFSTDWPSGSATLPGRDTTTWAYNTNTGLLTSKTDAKSNTTYYGYDDYNRPTGRLYPTGKLRKTAYNSQTGEVYSQKYYKNALDLTDTDQVDSDTPSVYFSYDRLGNVDEVLDGTGTREFAYSDTNELGFEGLLHKETIFADSSNKYYIEYDYDVGKRRLDDMSHGLSTAGISMDFGYSNSGVTGLLRTIAVSGISSPQTFSYAYESGTSWVNGITTTGYQFAHLRSYETNRNLVDSTESKWNGTWLGKVSHTRDSLGRITQLDRQYGMYGIYAGSGTRQTFGYTSKGELDETMTGTLAAPATALKGRTISLTYDGQGNRKLLQVDGSVSHTYVPGAANEFTSLTYGANVGSVSGMSEDGGTVVVGDSLAQRQGEYFFHGFGADSTASWTQFDILAAADPSPSEFAPDYAKDQADIYLPPSSVTPTYDVCGNLTYDGWWDYAYDGENRLISITSAIADYDGNYRYLGFEYDYLGRRVHKQLELRTNPSVPAATTESELAFVYWEWHLLGELNVSGTTPSLIRSYAWGLDKEGVRPGAGGVGGLLLVADHANADTYLAMNDYMGNVVGLVDASNGSIAAAYEYDPFGRTIRSTGSYADTNPLKFSSQYTDVETGLVYFGFRYYHPQWGRFINRDPIEEEGGINLYRFVSNDPVNRWDLLGLNERSGGESLLKALANLGAARRAGSDNQESPSPSEPDPVAQTLGNAYVGSLIVAEKVNDVAKLEMNGIETTVSTVSLGSSIRSAASNIIEAVRSPKSLMTFIHGIKASDDTLSSTDTVLSLSGSDAETTGGVVQTGVALTMGEKGLELAGVAEKIVGLVNLVDPIGVIGTLAGIASETLEKQDQELETIKESIIGIDPSSDD